MHPTCRHRFCATTRLHRRLRLHTSGAGLTQPPKNWQPWSAVLVPSRPRAAPASLAGACRRRTVAVVSCPAQGWERAPLPSTRRATVDAIEMRRLSLLLVTATRASLIPQNPDEGLVIVVARDESDCVACDTQWWAPPACPLLFKVSDRVDRWKTVQHTNHTAPCFPKQKNDALDTWPVCNKCYEERCCAESVEDCCVFDRQFVLNAAVLVFLVLASCCWGCWRGEQEARRKSPAVAAAP